jgi:hypothetical protein
MFDISVKYKDAAGVEKTVIINATSWEKIVPNVTLPFTARLKLAYTKKATWTSDKSTYALGRTYWIYSNGLSRKNVAFIVEDMPAASIEPHRDDTVAAALAGDYVYECPLVVD